MGVEEKGGRHEELLKPLCRRQQGGGHRDGAKGTSLGCEIHKMWSWMNWWGRQQCRDWGGGVLKGQSSLWGDKSGRDQPTPLP